MSEEASGDYRPSVPRSPSQDPEALLRTKFVAGDSDALEAVYAMHGPAVYTYANRAIGAEKAKDLTQEVFLSAWRARESFDPHRGSLGGWLMGITKNRLIDSYRKAGRRLDEAELSEPVRSRLVSNDHRSFQTLTDRMVLASALAMLPDRQRDVLTLAFWGDQTQQQIAEETGLPLGTVKSDMRRGLLKLRAELEQSDAAE